MIGEYLNIVLMCAMTAILFLGGWHSPFGAAFEGMGLLDQTASYWAIFWFTFKVVAVFFMFAMVKAMVPRYRYDQLMRLGWKVFLPISLFYVAAVAGFLVAFDLAPGGS